MICYMRPSSEDSHHWGASEIVSQHCKRFTSWTKVDIFFILTIRTKNEGLAMKNNNLFGIFQPLIFPFSSSPSALVKCSHGSPHG